MTATTTTPLPVCTSCGKSTRSHKRPRYCATCEASLRAFTEAYGEPAVTKPSLIGAKLHNTRTGEDWMIRSVSKTSDGFLIASAVLVDDNDEPVLDEGGWNVIHDLFLGRVPE